MAAPRTVLEDLPFALARATMAFRRLSDRTSRAYGLEGHAPGIATVLHALDEAGDCTVNVLVERSHFANGTLTGILDGLEGKGQIERLRNPRDGRSWIIRLTRRGRQLCGKLRRRHDAVMKLFGELLSDAESAELKRLLTKVTEGMRGYTHESPASPRRVRKSRSPRIPHQNPAPRASEALNHVSRSRRRSPRRA